MKNIVIPQPKQIAFDESKRYVCSFGFVLSSAYDSSESEIFLHLEKLFGIIVGDQAKVIEYQEQSNIPYEGYRLEIADNITIIASSRIGRSHGLMTLLQLIYSGIERNDVVLNPTTVTDEPRYSYRSYMLDVVRHFFPKEVLFSIIDVLQLLKFNTLHLHLTDDQGWRIQIDKYPRLTEIGSIRRGTLGDGKAVEGYYTKQDIREIVEYCALRNIEVIPELDMPGHFSAAIAAYPWLSCDGEPCEVQTVFGIHTKIACGGKQEVRTFISDVLTEIAEMFPSRYIHLGGDEAPKYEWERCPICKGHIAKEGLKNEEELQAELTSYAVSVLEGLGKRAIVWNEAASSGTLAANVLLQFWNDGKRFERVKDELKKGRSVIVSKFIPLYLDYPCAISPLKAIYGFDMALTNSQYDDNIIGVEAPLWTEYVENEKQVYRQTFPRIFAISEIGWCDKREDYSGFEERVGELTAIVARFGIMGAPMKTVNPRGFKKLKQLFAFAKNFLKKEALRSMGKAIKIQLKTKRSRRNVKSKD